MPERKWVSISYEDFGNISERKQKGSLLLNMCRTIIQRARVKGSGECNQMLGSVLRREGRWHRCFEVERKKTLVP